MWYNNYTISYTNIHWTSFLEGVISKQSFLLKSYWTCPSQITTPSPLELAFIFILIFTSNGKIKGRNDNDNGHIGTNAIQGTLFYIKGPPALKQYAVDPVGVLIINPSILINSKLIPPLA